MKAARIVALIMLGFLGVTALMSGIPMMLDPSGGMLRMPLSLLAHSPFHDFLIPGTILTVWNGLLNFYVIVAVLRRWNCDWKLVGLQGFVIVGWITVEVILLRSVVWLHWVYWITGAVLIGCGLDLRREQHRARSAVIAVR